MVHMAFMKRSWVFELTLMFLTDLKFILFDFFPSHVFKNYII